MTVSGAVLSTKPISLSKATSTLSSFVSSDTGASQEFSVYLQRALASFKELKQLHKELKAPRSQRSPSRLRSEAENDYAEIVGENPTRSVVVSQEVSHGIELESKPKPTRQRQESNSNGRLENEEPNLPVVDVVERRKEEEKKEKKGEFLNFRADRGAIAERGGEAVEKSKAFDPVEVQDKKKKKRDNVSNSDENGGHFEKGDGEAKIRNKEVKKEEGKKRKSAVSDALEENLDKKKKRRKS